ncbi:hypothetical protein SNE40_015474 [Patella caerulea]|uniref:C-type lectin domain-containing protein n=1 Tax=Patella caerulea TaxID=87958 RepID=A0AAN8PS33_PATCE
MCYLHRYVYDETSPTQISNTTYYVSPLRACPNTYALKSGFCFRIYWTEKNFYDARTVCQADGGDLVIFDSQEKTDTIIQDLIPSKRYVFGMFNIQSDKSFDLVDGRTSADFPFRFWKPNRPDGPFDIPLCGSLNHNSYGYYWTDSDCNFKRTIICEVK